MSPHGSSSAAAPLDAAAALPTPQQLAALRAELVQYRKQKQAELPAVDDSLLAADDVAHAQAQAAREALQSVDAALARLDAGTYGRCVHCSSVIPLARLEILPHTDSCVACRARMAGR